MSVITHRDDVITPRPSGFRKHDFYEGPELISTVIKTVYPVRIYTKLSLSKELFDPPPFQIHKMELYIGMLGFACGGKVLQNRNLCSLVCLILIIDNTRHT